MPFSSPTELLTWLSDNYFLNPQQVGDLRSWVERDADLHNFCKEMLRRNWLTPYQVNQLLKNNGETLIVGANRIHSRLGEGAMGQVFRAWNVRLGRMVALKMLHADHAISPKAKDRFRREMQTAAALVHPNIVLLRDADETNNVPYLVMDFFDGVDLSKKMRQEGPQPIKLACEYIRQAAIGLQHAYENGVVHRDIKPSNLLLVKGPDGGPVIKILDFGLAKFEREEEGQQPLTQAGRLIGTVDYIAPEQATDAHNADVRADIYSLGCTLYYLLTAKAPFPGADHLEKLSARLKGNPPRLRDVRPDAPAGLEAVLLKIMAREPADRYRTPGEVVAALAPFTRETPASEPVAVAMRPGTATIVAQPVAQPAPLALALPPIAKSASVNTVVAATTVAAAVPSQAEDGQAQFTVEGNQFPFGNGSEHFETIPDVAPPRPRRMTHVPDAFEEDAPEERSMRRPLLFGVAGLALLMIVGVASFFLLNRAIVPNRVVGNLTIQLDSPPGRIWAKGERKPVIVKISRQNFAGVVDVAVDPCPGWLSAQPIKIAPNKEIGEMRLIVKFDDFVGPETIRFVASSPDSNPATVSYDMEVVAHRGVRVPDLKNPNP